MITHVYVLVAVGVVGVLAKPPYQNQIPNGDKVPHPCDHTYWATVGHLVDTQGAASALNLNPFGQDFAGDAHHWTHHLCHRDSDHDGKTNGQELGDPTCVWAVGSALSFPASGHPGINENTYDCSAFRG